MSNLWLLMLLAVPLIGSIVTMILQPEVARKWALFVSIATFLVSCVVASQLSDSLLSGGPAPDYNTDPIAGINASFHLGVDPISMWLVLLTTFLTPLAIAASFTAITERTREYYSWMLALLVVMLGVFIARDLLLFYVFFELTLVPMFFIIGIWGGPERRYAAGKFFLFTFAGGVFTLAATIYLGSKAGTFDIPTIVRVAQTQIGPHARWWIVLGLLAGFAVKIPLFPVHTWLPLAHTEAPTAGSVILAGVLLKLGTYGLLRLAVPIGLVAAGGGVATNVATLIHFLGALCIIGIIYGALVAWVQQDIKKLVAYSSVSHLGFCILGLLALNDIGMQGSVLYMINHGLSTGAMFLVIGMVYERFHTRDIDKLSGLARKMPIFAFFFVFFTLASIGLPGLNGFWSEFLTILGAFTSEHLGIGYGVLAATGVVLGAVYMLHMVARVIFGPLKFPGDGHDTSHQAHSEHPVAHGLSGDLNHREIGILVPLALAVVLLGVYPNLIVGPIRGPLEHIMNVHNQKSIGIAAAPPHTSHQESL
jgi:NADH-quinone oxidoreductase subunit M